MENTQPKKIALELSIAWLIVIGGSRLSNLLSGVPFLGDNLSLITAALLLYTPIIIHFRNKEQVRYFDSTAKDYRHSLLWFLLSAGLIFPLIAAGNHFYQGFLGNHYHAGHIKRPIELILFEIMVVALPEEFFFRGYMQNRLNLVWKKKWKLLGVSFGPALPIVCLIFAVSHSLIQFQWWHIFIFFPSLAFGWLYEKRGTITAPVLFHAVSNIFAQWVFVHY